MSAKPLSGLEKAAVLLKSLSPIIVEKVLAHLEPKQAKVLSAELAKVSARPDLKEAASQVLDEAVTVLAEDKPQSRTPAQANAKATAPGRAAAVDIRLEGSPAEELKGDSDPLKAIASIAPDILTMALENESARTVSLLINRMDLAAAGQVYRRLSPEKRKEVSLRFTDATPISDDLLRHLADAVVRKCQALAIAPPAANVQGEREKRMAELLRSLERADRMETLTVLEESDAELAARLKAMLYLFEDILRLENTSIQKLLSEIDMKALASALYGAPPEIAERIMANLSRRAQESLKEEIELTGKVPAAAVKQARQSLEEAMQRLDQRGEFLIKES